MAQPPAWFYRAGLGGGIHHSSFVPAYNDNPIATKPRLGGQVNAFALHQLVKSLDLETGIFHSIGGMTFGEKLHPYHSGHFSTIHSTGVSFSLYYHVSSQIHLAFGTTHALITANNLPYSNDVVDFGLKGACGVYLTPRCRISVHYTHNFALHPVVENSAGTYRFYRNALAGISMAYELHQKRDYSGAPDFKHPCPRF